MYFTLSEICSANWEMLMGEKSLFFFVVDFNLRCKQNTIEPIIGFHHPMGVTVT